jgi:hypothetical protein
MTDIMNNLEDLPNMTSLPPPVTSSSLPGTGIANLPNQRHKIVAKNGANFTIMVCGKYLTLQSRAIILIHQNRRVWCW